MCAALKNKKAVILGSGGARGLAHLGVWKTLCDMGFKKADFISGTSMGAFIGALMADCKNIDSVYRTITGMSTHDWLKLFTLHIPVSGFVSGKKIERFMSGFFKKKKIEDLKTKFMCCAFNYSRSREEYFERGPLVNALRASMSIPVILDPYKIKSDYYVDGAVAEPLPIKPAVERGFTDMLVINVVSKPTRHEFSDVMTNRFHFIKKNPRSAPAPALLEVAVNNLNFLEWQLIQNEKEIYKPRFCLDIPTDEYHLLDFTKSKEIILLGENTALKNRDMLLEFLNS